jgi:hypothetical protein
MKKIEKSPKKIFKKKATRIPFFASLLTLYIVQSKQTFERSSLCIAVDGTKRAVTTKFWVSLHVNRNGICKKTGRDLI